MLPDPVSNPGPLTYESVALPTALRSPANMHEVVKYLSKDSSDQIWSNFVQGLL